ncbi:MAG: ATP-binding cassette domain-containing protein [Dehalococcoidia bacterium]
MGAVLAYGDQRRLELGRALATEPRLLLLDEPTAGMNPQETVGMMRFVERLRAERGLTVLLIEHDMKVVMGISDRVTVLDHGEKIAEGSPAAIRRDRGGGLSRTGGGRRPRHTGGRRAWRHLRFATFTPITAIFTRSRASASAWTPVRSSRSSVRTAPASPPRSRPSPGWYGRVRAV